MTFEELNQLLDSSLIAWHRLYQPWIIAHLVVANGRASMDELCEAYPRGLSAWDWEETKLTPEQRIRSAVRTLEKNGFIEYDSDGGVRLNCTPTPVEKLLIIDKCLSKSLSGISLRECLQPHGQGKQA